MTGYVSTCFVRTCFVRTILKLFLGFLFCSQCGTYFKAVQKGSQSYRSAVIKQHTKRESHQNFLKKEEESYWAKFKPIERERLVILWIQIMARYGIQYSVFQKDSLLKEGVCLAIESQIKQKVDRKSVDQLFPSPREMARKLPIMKQKIDGEYFIILNQSQTSPSTSLKIVS